MPEGAIWQSGAGPAADPQGNFGNSFLKLSAQGGKLAINDYFTMFDVAQENASDGDLGSGGPLVLPDMKNATGRTEQLVIGAGKDRNIYTRSCGRNFYNAAGTHDAILHAYDARDLSRELYNSDQAPSARDKFGGNNKFITPMIAGGRVYVGTPNSVAVFGLLRTRKSAIGVLDLRDVGQVGNLRPIGNRPRRIGFNAGLSKRHKRKRPKISASNSARRCRAWRILQVDRDELS